MTNRERIERHLKDYKTITQLECAREYGNYRLSEYIRQLRCDGWNIVSNYVKGINRYGEDTTYVRYELKED